MSKKNRHLPANQQAIRPAPLTPQVSRQVTAEMKAEMSIQYTSPLPPPGILAGYNDVQEGLVERIVTWTEEETRFRRESFVRQQRWDNWKDVGGMASGMILTLAILYGAYRLLMADKPIGGIAALIAALVPLVTAFVVMRRRRE